MKEHHRIPAYAGLLAMLLAAGLSGCSAPKPDDPDQARATLTTALDAWQSGRTIDEVTNGSPAIVVSDPAWKNGFKLSRYQIAEKTSAAGLDLKFPVALRLQDPKGKDVEEKVNYTVSVQPTRTVLRSPF
jgi:hypothetical protein